MSIRFPEIPYFCIDKGKYRTEDDFFAAVGRLTDELTRNDYDVLVQYEDCGIYRVLFAHAEGMYGDDMLIGVTAEQYDALCSLADEDVEDVEADNER